VSRLPVLSRVSAVSRLPALNRLPVLSRLPNLIRLPVPRQPALSGAGAALGLLTLAWPLAWAPGWAYGVAVLGAAAVLAGSFARWRRGPGLAVAAAILACAFSRAGTLVLTAEGLFILGYLLAGDAPVGLVRLGPWFRRQLRLCVAGVIAAGAVLAALALRPAPSAVLTAAGLAAAAGAYLIALPSGRAGRRDSDVDVQ
jgi:hypothetical protein